MNASPKASLLDRLRYTVADNGCWHWSGYVMPNGYGTVSVTALRKKGPIGAHVLSWIAHNGPLPIIDGRVADVDHVCHNNDPTCEDGWACLHRRCINPLHLRTTSRNTNLKAGRKPGRKPRGGVT